MTPDITDRERKALLKVRDMLATMPLTDIDGLTDDGVEVTRGFNMNYTVQENACGTVACIGGWMAKVMGKRGLAVHHYVNRPLLLGLKHGHSDALRGLFYPRRLPEVSWGNITPEQARQAITNFLETGDPKWPEVVAGTCN